MRLSFNVAKPKNGYSGWWCMGRTTLPTRMSFQDLLQRMRDEYKSALRARASPAKIIRLLNSKLRKENAENSWKLLDFQVYIWSPSSWSCWSQSSRSSSSFSSWLSACRFETLWWSWFLRPALERTMPSTIPIITQTQTSHSSKALTVIVLVTEVYK